MPRGHYSSAARKQIALRPTPLADSHTYYSKSHSFPLALPLTKVQRRAACHPRGKAGHVPPDGRLRSLRAQNEPHNFPDAPLCRRPGCRLPASAAGRGRDELRPTSGTRRGAALTAAPRPRRPPGPAGSPGLQRRWARTYPRSAECPPGAAGTGGRALGRVLPSFPPRSFPPFPRSVCVSLSLKDEVKSLCWS